MAKQSQQMVAVMAVMVLLCASMMSVQVNAQGGWPAPAPYMRGPSYAPEYAPEGSPVSAPVAAAPSYGPSSGPSYGPGPTAGM